MKYTNSIFYIPILFFCTSCNFDKDGDNCQFIKNLRVKQDVNENGIQGMYIYFLLDFKSLKNDKVREEIDFNTELYLEENGKLLKTTTGYLELSDESGNIFISDNTFYSTVYNETIPNIDNDTLANSLNNKIDKSTALKFTNVIAIGDKLYESENYYIMEDKYYKSFFIPYAALNLKKGTSNLNVRLKLNGIGKHITKNQENLFTIIRNRYKSTYKQNILKSITINKPESYELNIDIDSFSLSRKKASYLDFFSAPDLKVRITSGNYIFWESEVVNETYSFSIENRSKNIFFNISKNDTVILNIYDDDGIIFLNEENVVTYEIVPTNNDLNDTQIINKPIGPINKISVHWSIKESSYK